MERARKRCTSCGLQGRCGTGMISVRAERALAIAGGSAVSWGPNLGGGLLGAAIAPGQADCQSGGRWSFKGGEQAHQQTHWARQMRGCRRSNRNGVANSCSANTGFVEARSALPSSEAERLY